jgi:hypothetical protein
MRDIRNRPTKQDGLIAGKEWERLGKFTYDFPVHRAAQYVTVMDLWTMQKADSWLQAADSKPRPTKCKARVPVALG